MDQKLVADILQAEIQVGLKIKQNQDNLKQFSEFNPEHAFETLKKFYINSYNLNSSQLQQSQSKFGNVPGATYKGVVDLEKLTLLYRQYEETVTSFEIQAILSRHSSASEKGMDYDCFLKFIGYNIGDTKRKNQIFDSQARTERSLTERCMKALSSLFLLELDLLRFTEVHKVSLINNYGFDSASFFSQIDYKNQSQIDFELLSQFFRRNGQEISQQEYQILLQRLKRNKQYDMQSISSQEFIQLISPQLPYRGKNYLGQSVIHSSPIPPSFNSSAAAAASLNTNNLKSVKFQDNQNILIRSNFQEQQDQPQTFRQPISSTSSRILQGQVQPDSQIHNQVITPNKSQIQNNITFQQSQHVSPPHSKLIQDQSQYSLPQPALQPVYPPQLLQQYPPQALQQYAPQALQQYAPQALQQYAPQALQQYPPHQAVLVGQAPGNFIGVQQPPLVDGSQGVQMNAPQGLFMLAPGQVPPPAPPGYVLVQHGPSAPLIMSVGHVQYPGEGVVVQPSIYEKQEEGQKYRQQQEQNDRFNNDKLRPNAVLEAMNEILKKDNDSLKKNNHELMQKMVEFEQAQIREQEQQKRLDDQRKQREEEFKKKREEELKKLREEEQRKNEEKRIQQQQQISQAQLQQQQQYPSHITYGSGIPPSKIISHKIVSLPPQYVQSQIRVSPPMSPIRLIPHHNRDDQIVQQFVPPQQVQVTNYPLQHNISVPNYLLNNNPIQNNYNQPKFNYPFIPKYNPQNI